MKRTLTMMMLAGALALTTPAAAQGPLAQKRAAVRQQVMQYMMQQLTQELALDASAAARVREIWERYQQQIDGVHREQGMIFKELKSQLAAPTPDNARLTQLSDLAFANRQKAESLDLQRVGEFKRMLTPPQFAKLILLSPKLRREIQQQVWKAMKDAQPQPADEE
jgi:hypothetical protein